MIGQGKVGIVVGLGVGLQQGTMYCQVTGVVVELDCNKGAWELSVRDVVVECGAGLQQGAMYW